MPNFYEPFASRYAAGVREGCKRGGRGVGMGVCGDWAGPLYTAAAGLTPATLLGCIFARRRWIRALTLARSRPPNKTSREETRRCRTGLFLFAAFFPPRYSLRCSGRRCITPRFFRFFRPRFDDRTITVGYSSFRRSVFPSCQRSSEFFPGNKREREEGR